VIWDDQSRNGVQDGGEPGRANADVMLYAGTCGATNFPILQTQTTGSDGVCEFATLAGEAYWVQAFAASVPADMTLTT